MLQLRSLLTLRSSILILCVAVVTTLSMLSFLKRNGKVSFGEYVREVVEFFHVITFDTTKFILKKIPFLDIHVTGFNSDILWVFMVLLLPPCIIVFRDKDTGYIMKAAYIVVLLLFGRIFLDLFDKTRAIEYEEHAILREYIWGAFIKGIIVNQIALISYSLGLIGRDAQMKAIRTYVAIIVAVSAAVILYGTGLIQIIPAAS